MILASFWDHLGIIQGPSGTLPGASGTSKNIKNHKNHGFRLDHPKNDPLDE